MADAADELQLTTSPPTDDFSRASDGGESGPSGGGRSVLLHCGVWVAILAAALVLMIGRYDWSESVRAFTRRGYLSSAYMLVLLLPAAYYLVRRLTQSGAWATAVTAVALLVVALPYRWLGLDAYRCYDGPPYWWNAAVEGAPALHFQWLPGAWGSPGMPHELSFFLTLLTVGVCLLGVAGLVGWMRSRRDGRPASAGGWIMLVAFVLICAQTWLHLSMRSPNTYCTRLNPAWNGNWYIDYLFADGTGAVNQDLFVWRGLEFHFEGAPFEPDTMLIRRAFPFYLSHTFSHFFNPYYVWLVFNVVFWLAAVGAAYRFARLHFEGRVATYFALLVACGAPFIAMVAQPKGYLAGSAWLLFIPYLLEVLIVRRTEHRLGAHVLFGVVLGWAMLSYDVYALYLLIPLYTWWRTGSLGAAVRVCACLVMAVMVDQGFVALQRYGIGLELNTYNSDYLGRSMRNALALLQSGDPMAWYTAAVDAFSRFARYTFVAFLFVPAVWAALGALFRPANAKAGLAFLFLLTALANYLFLHFGGTELKYEARYTYLAYPGVYLLAAMFWAWWAEKARAVLPRWLAVPVAALPFVAVLIVSNMDAFGFPQIYYMVYFPESPGDFSLLGL